MLFYTHKDPDFVNDIGVKFWLSDAAVKYAVSKGINDIVVWCTEHPDTSKRVLVLRGTEIVGSFDSLLLAYDYIDKLAIDGNFKKSK